MRRTLVVLLAVLLPLTSASAMPRDGDWPTWQGDVTGSRHNGAEHRITAASVGKLKLKWAFAYPKSPAPVKSQPAVVDGGIYFGGPDGMFYALDARTGETRWTFALNPGAVVWDGPAVARGKIYIGASSAENTGDATTPCCTFRGHIDALDYDIGATPNLFRVGGRTFVGVGQKSGAYHAFNARTGEVAWRRQVGVPLPSGGISGIQWGSSYDGRRLYVATYFAGPGTLFALDPATGQVLWETPNPADGCTTGGAAHPDLCALAHTPAVTTSPGVVYESSTDGKMRAYSARTGSVLWQYDTIREFTGVNGRTGYGSSISGNGGAVVAGGMLYVQAGYYPFYPSEHGNVLPAFGL